MKNTIQKTAVLDALMQLNHPSADDVYECVNNKFPSISKGSVYRILNCLSNEGTIIKISIPDGADRFDPTLLEHQHIKCSSCGKVYDVFVPELPKIEKRLEKESGFSVDKCKLVFSGICSDCLVRK